jgi:hypothetical protein
MFEKQHIRKWTNAEKGSIKESPKHVFTNGKKQISQRGMMIKKWRMLEDIKGTKKGKSWNN